MTFSADEDISLDTLAATAVQRLHDFTETVQMGGCDITIILSRVEADGALSHALVSTVDDHELLADTLDHVVEDYKEGYAEDDDEDQPELPFEKVSLQ